MAPSKTPPIIKAAIVSAGTTFLRVSKRLLDKPSPVLSATTGCAT